MGCSSLPVRLSAAKGTEGAPDSAVLARASSCRIRITGFGFAGLGFAGLCMAGLTLIIAVARCEQLYWS